jgi:mono/diheme cytochrome c family protein
MLKKVLLGAAAIAVIVLLLAVVVVEARWTRTFEAPYPAIHATNDPAVIAQGQYLVYAAAACAYCHVPSWDWQRLDRGEATPLTGGHAVPLSFGTFYSANLTPDPETGIGRRSDGELARILRHGVRADGRASMPFMEYARMSEEDVRALLSFLRSQPAVRNEVPDHRIDLLGRARFAFLIQPPHAARARKTSPRGVDAERGEYLANDVAVCVACHTNRDRMAGAFTGPPFAGGQRMDYMADVTKVQVPPNLTPAPKTGKTAALSENDFVERFQKGSMFPESLMPWGAYRRMTDGDLRSIYRYLRTLPAIENDTGPIIQDK